jgi:hypothetical protein
MTAIPKEESLGFTIWTFIGYSESPCVLKARAFPRFRFDATQKLTILGTKRLRLKFFLAKP